LWFVPSFASFAGGHPRLYGRRHGDRVRDASSSGLREFNMKKHIDTLSSFIVGLIFGIGLIFAGMTDPSKVIGFLDIAGNWDPSLAFVMGGAILVGFVAFRFANNEFYWRRNASAHQK
jgi:hypothetical protein